MKYNSLNLSQIICHVIRLNHTIYFSMAEPDRICLYCIFAVLLIKKIKKKKNVCETKSHLKLSSIDCRNCHFFISCLLIFPLRCKLLFF